MIYLAKDDFRSEFDDYIKSRRKVISKRKTPKKNTERKKNKKPFFKKFNIKDLFHDKIIDYGDGIKIVEKGEFKLKKKIQEFFSSKTDYVDLENQNKIKVSKLNANEGKKIDENNHNQTKKELNGVKTKDKSIFDYINPFKLIPKINKKESDLTNVEGDLKKHKENKVDDHELEIDISEENQHVSIVELNNSNYFDSLKSKASEVISEIKKVFSKADEKRVNLDDFEKRSIKKSYNILNDFIKSISKLDEDEKRILMTHDDFQYLLNLENEIEEDVKNIEKDISNLKATKKSEKSNDKSKVKSKDQTKSKLNSKKSKSKKEIKRNKAKDKKKNYDIKNSKKSEESKKPNRNKSKSDDYSKLDEDVSKLNKLIDKFRGFFRKSSDRHVINIDISEKDKEE